MDSLAARRAFRDPLYRCFDRHVDAIFELTDALLLIAGAAPSPLHLQTSTRGLARDGNILA